MLKMVVYRVIIFLFFSFAFINNAISQDFLEAAFDEADSTILPEGSDTVLNVLPEPVVADTRYDYIPEVAPEVIRERMKNINSTIKLTYNDKVAAFINYFAVRNRDYTRLMVQRQNLYFPLFEKYLKKHGMPDELKYLSIVESGLNPKAGSRVGAMGLWQFMPATGRLFKLEQDMFHR
jgi:membrane-bound lytic murein transglycosylase D